MKLKSIVSTSLLAAFAALSISAQAASATDNAPEANAPAASVQTGKAASSKKHSHVEEKTGIPQKTPETVKTKPSPEKDMKTHYHPRDGK